MVSWSWSTRGLLFFALLVLLGWQAAESFVLRTPSIAAFPPRIVAAQRCRPVNEVWSSSPEGRSFSSRRMISPSDGDIGDEEGTPIAYGIQRLSHGEDDWEMPDMANAFNLPIRPGEDPLRAMDNLERLVRRAGIPSIVRVKRYHETAHEMRKRKAKEVRMRILYLRKMGRRKLAAKDYPLGFTLDM